jgi:hypothetical protein
MQKFKDSRKDSLTVALKMVNNTVKDMVDKSLVPIRASLQELTATINTVMTTPVNTSALAAIDNMVRNVVDATLPDLVRDAVDALLAPLATNLDNLDGKINKVRELLLEKIDYYGGGVWSPSERR